MHHYVILHLEKERTMYTRAVVLFCSKFLCFTEVPGKERPLLCSAGSQDSQHHHLQHARKGRCSAGPSS